MIYCRLAEFVINAIPIRGLQDFLIRRHVQKCPRCEARLISREAARSFLNADMNIAEDPGFVRTVMARAARRNSPEVAGPTGAHGFARWAAAAAGLALVVGVTLWLVLDERGASGRKETEGGETFRINYLNVDGAPVNPLVIQPRDSDMVIIWADRDLGSPDRIGKPGGRP
jgi:hypothetical protein